MLTTETGSQSPESPGEQDSPPRTSRLAIASLILAALGFFSLGLTAIVGFVLGIISLIQIRRSEGRLVGRDAAITGIVFSLLIPVFFYPVYMMAREKSRQSTCLSNLKSISLGAMQYAQDYDDKFPPTANWNAVLLPYYRSSQVLRCPSAGWRSMPGYAMNKSLGSVSLKKAAAPAETAGIFESIPGKDQAGGIELLPIPGRHYSGSSIGFADGHVKWRRDANYGEIRWKP